MDLLPVAPRKVAALAVVSNEAVEDTSDDQMLDEALARELALVCRGGRLGAESSGADALRREAQDGPARGPRGPSCNRGVPSEDALDVSADCRADAGAVVAPVRFGLAVTLEMAETVRVDLYEQARSALEVQLR